MKFTPTNQNQLNNLTNLVLVKDRLFNNGYWCTLLDQPPANHVVDHYGYTLFDILLLGVDVGFSTPILISDTGDTPFVAGNNYFQITRILFHGLGFVSDARLRIAHDNGGTYANYAAAVAAMSYFESMGKFNDPSHVIPQGVNCPLIPAGSKVWAACWANTLGDDIHFYLSYEIIEYTL